MINNLEKVLNSLADMPQILEEYLKSIPDECLDVKRNPETWTIREHVYHIAETQEMLFQRILKIKEDKEPVITPFIPDDSGEDIVAFNSIEEAVEKVKSFREKQVSVLKQLSLEELEKEAIHPEYNRYNLPILTNHILFHEYWHIYRIEEIWLQKDGLFK